MLTVGDLTDIQWQIAHAIAQTLVKKDANVNELSKAITYLRTYAHQENAGSRFSDYLKTLVKNGQRVGHSQKTLDYYQSIDNVCSDYLKGYQADPGAMLQILGWSARLMRYYENAGPIGEITAPIIESTRQAEIAEAIQSQTFTLGQIVDATVTNIQGNKITYEILLTKQRFTNKEPKNASFLKTEQKVKVEITAFKEDGSIKSVKMTE